MRTAFVLAALAGLASAQTKPAWRLVPMGEFGYAYDGGGMEKAWNDATGLRYGVGTQCTFYSPKEDSMGWAVVGEVYGNMFTADIEGSKLLADGSESGSSLEAMTFGGRVQTGPFYRMLGLWGNSGGLVGLKLDYTNGDALLYREQYVLSFGVYTEVGSDPWAQEGIRVGIMGARLGGSEEWPSLYNETAISDSTEWLLEGFEAGGMVEYWRGPFWGQVAGSMTSTDLRHRSEEGSTGEGFTWQIALRLGYRFSWGDLKGFR
jgi:hypothetical protein